MREQRNRRDHGGPMEEHRRRQDWRGSNEAFWWGFAFSFWGLIVVAITKDDYPEGTNPLANAIYGILAAGVLLGFVLWVVLLVVMST